MTVPSAEPIVPSAGIGPSPRIRIRLSTTLRIVIVTPSRIGVRASPAARSAVVSMKNISMPMLKVKLTRRNGIASSRTAGEAFAKSSSSGDAK